MGDLICTGKSGNFPSEEQNEERYLELRNEIDDLQEKNLEIETDIDNLRKTDLELRTHVDDVSEKNYAFKYRVGNGIGAIISYETVKFDTRVYGSGVVDGVYTAPIGNN